jgi:formate dehydrogenase subunit delta
MANQIGRFFETDPDHCVGMAGIANHLTHFWDPRMRKALISYLDTEGTVGFNPFVGSALTIHRAQILAGSSSE